MGAMAQWWSGMRRDWSRLRHFLMEGVWDLEPTSLSFVKRMGVRLVRVVSLVIEGFRADECPMHAAALTFNTLMAIVPVLALSLSLARGLGNEEAARARIRDLVAEWTSGFGTNHVVQVEATEASEAAGGYLAGEINRLVESGFEKVENVRFAALGGVGLAVLLWMVVAVLGKIENSFNRVWGVTAGRSLWRKFTDYLSVLFIAPFLALLASSLPAADFATRYLDPATARVVEAFLASGLLKALVTVTLTSLFFAVFIMFMPNTRVRTVPGLVGGLVCGLAFLGWLWICAALQVGAARYGKIYGSFAVVPIVLAWVYVSWEIVLFGAEVAFGVQNCGTYGQERHAGQASVRARAGMALRLVVEGARAMRAGTVPGVDIAALARERRLPVRFVNTVVSELAEAGLIGELVEHPGHYVLLRDPEGLTARAVVDAILQAGGDQPADPLADVPRLAEVLDAAHRELGRALDGSTIAALAR